MFLGLSSVVSLVIHLKSLCSPSETLHNRCSVYASQINIYVQMYKADMASLSATQDTYWGHLFFSPLVFPVLCPLFFLPFLSFFLFPFSFKASVFCFHLICYSSVFSSFLFFFLSFPFCFLFLHHVFLSSAFVHLPIIYLLIPRTPMDIVSCQRRSQGLRGLSRLLDRPLTVVTGEIDIFIAVCLE